MRLLAFNIIVLLSIVPIKLMAQRSKYRADTVYYLVDTASIPKYDRMVKVGFEVNADFQSKSYDTTKYYRFNLPCLPNGYYPTFIVRKGRKLMEMSKNQVKQNKLSNLSALVTMVLKDYKHDFINKHVIIMIERVKQKHYKQEVFLAEYADPTVDYIIIRTDSGKIKP